MTFKTAGHMTDAELAEEIRLLELPLCAGERNRRGALRYLRREQEIRAQAEVVHQCPPGVHGTTPCCGKTPFELPRTDRMTLEQAQVTCGA